MKLRSLKDQDHGVVGIVVAFLITGLIVIVISIVQTVYVPKWMEQAEADHMEIVADQFSQLKFAIDTQSAIRKPDTPRRPFRRRDPGPWTSSRPAICPATVDR